MKEIKFSKFFGGVSFHVGCDRTNRFFEQLLRWTMVRLYSEAIIEIRILFLKRGTTVLFIYLNILFLTYLLCLWKTLALLLRCFLLLELLIIIIALDVKRNGL